MKTGRYHCPNQCGRHYKQKSGLKQHLKNECGVLPRFVCSICLKSCSYKNVLKLHMATVHNLLLDLNEDIWLWLL